MELASPGTNSWAVALSDIAAHKCSSRLIGSSESQQQRGWEEGQLKRTTSAPQRLEGEEK